MKRDSILLGNVTMVVATLQQTLQSFPFRWCAKPNDSFGGSDTSPPTTWACFSGKVPTGYGRIAS